MTPPKSQMIALYHVEFLAFVESWCHACLIGQEHKNGVLFLQYSFITHFDALNAVLTRRIKAMVVRGALSARLSMAENPNWRFDAG